MGKSNEKAANLIFDHSTGLWVSQTEKPMRIVCIAVKNPFIILTKPVVNKCTETCGENQQCNRMIGECQCLPGYFDINVKKRQGRVKSTCAKCCERSRLNTNIQCVDSGAGTESRIHTCSNGTDDFLLVDNDDSKWKLVHTSNTNKAIVTSPTTDTSCLDPSLSNTRFKLECDDQLL